MPPKFSLAMLKKGVYFTMNTVIELLKTFSASLREKNSLEFQIEILKTEGQVRVYTNEKKYVLYVFKHCM